MDTPTLLVPAQLGNLAVRVGSGTLFWFFIVSEALMRQKSGVIAGLIADAGINRLITLPAYSEDEQVAWRLILKAVNGDLSGNDPDQMNLNRLSAVCRIASGYELISTVQPLLAQWMALFYQNAGAGATSTKMRDNLQMRVSISWSFGQRKPFAAAMTELIFKTRVANVNSPRAVIIVGDFDELLELTCLPGGSLKVISNQITATLRALEAAAVKLENGLKSPTSHYFVVKKSKASEKCQYEMLESIICKIKKLDQIPSHWTVADYANHLGSIVVEPLNHSHSKCAQAVNLQELADRVLKGRKFIWCDMFSRHFRDFNHYQWPATKLETED